MLSLETIGYYADAPGSQRYPWRFGLFYPDTGDFIGFVGNLGSRALVRRAVAAFRRHAAFPSEAVAAPGWLARGGVDALLVGHPRAAARSSRCPRAAIRTSTPCSSCRRLASTAWASASPCTRTTGGRPSKPVYQCTRPS